MASAQTTIDPRCPVTLLTGFLGAGKTTLLNHVLRHPGQERIAVIVNEFGDAGLDHDLMDTADEDVVLMRSGCLCCSMRGDLARVLHRMLKRRHDGEILFDRIVIETTGLADPAPIIQTLRMDAGLARSVHLDGIVTVADSAAGPATLDAHFEAVSQIAMADLIILSKTNLVTLVGRSGFERRIRAINATAGIIHAARGDVPAHKLWGLSPTRSRTDAQSTTDWLSAAIPKLGPSDTHGRGMAHGGFYQDRHAHDQRIDSVSIMLDAPVEDVVFDRWLDTLVALRGPDLLRVKGVVHIDGLPKPFVFHGVQHVFDPPVPVEDWPVGDRQSRIIVIARDISRPALQRSLNMLRDHANPNGPTTARGILAGP